MALGDKKDEGMEEFKAALGMSSDRNPPPQPQQESRPVAREAAPDGAPVPQAEAGQQTPGAAGDVRTELGRLPFSPADLGSLINAAPADSRARAVLQSIQSRIMGLEGADPATAKAEVDSILNDLAGINLNEVKELEAEKSMEQVRDAAMMMVGFGVAASNPEVGAAWAAEIASGGATGQQYAQSQSTDQIGVAGLVTPMLLMGQVAQSMGMVREDQQQPQQQQQQQQQQVAPVMGAVAAAPILAVAATAGTPDEKKEDGPSPEAKKANKDQLVGLLMAVDGISATVGKLSRDALANIDQMSTQLVAVASKASDYTVQSGDPDKASGALLLDPERVQPMQTANVSQNRARGAGVGV